MSYLNAVVCTAAQGNTQLSEIPFLGETRQVPYYRVFSDSRLKTQQMVDLLAHHMQHTAQAAGWGAEAVAHASVFIGSTAYTVAESERLRLNQHIARAYSLHELSDGLQQRYPQQTIYNFATSCTSAAHALIQAHRQLHTGMIRHAFVLGIESHNLLSLAHFYSIGLLGDCYQPFAGNGFILGEGVACLALSTMPSEGFNMQLMASAANTDSSNLTDTHPEYLYQVMQHALGQAQISPEAVLLVKAHAVGSRSSDQAERTALNQLAIQHPYEMWCKPYTGHTLGASAAIETAMLYQVLQQQTLSAHLASDGVAHNLPTQGVCLANFFGFGGNNTAMIWNWSHEYPCLFD